MGQTCSSINVPGGSTCADLAVRCGVSLEQFSAYNVQCQGVDANTILNVHAPVCCTSGRPPKAKQEEQEAKKYKAAEKKRDDCPNNAQTQDDLIQVFYDAIGQSEYSTQDVPDDDLRDFATRLVGWDGCYPCGSPDMEKQIYRGWQESWKIMNQVKQELDGNSGKINFNEAAAVEYLGPPGFIERHMDAFNKIFLNLATIQPRYVQLPFDWRIAVRCDDWGNKCNENDDDDDDEDGEDGEPNIFAYASQQSPGHPGVATINFCPKYFETRTLKKAMETADSPVDLVRLSVREYQKNQARVWIHELLHIDWVSLAGNGEGQNYHVTDLDVYYRIPDMGIKKVKAYGAELVKGLARWSADPGQWTITNADSMALYAMARYVQKALGNIYPHLPLAPRAPLRIEQNGGDQNGEDKPPLEVGDDHFLTVYSNDTLDFRNSLAGSPADLSNQVPEDIDKNGSWALTLTYDGFIRETDFPSDYIASWSSWSAALPPQSQAPAPAPTDSGDVTITQVFTVIPTPF